MVHLTLIRLCCPNILLYQCDFVHLASSIIIVHYIYVYLLFLTYLVPLVIVNYGGSVLIFQSCIIDRLVVLCGLWIWSSDHAIYCLLLEKKYIVTDTHLIECRRSKFGFVFVTGECLITIPSVRDYGRFLLFLVLFQYIHW